MPLSMFDMFAGMRSVKNKKARWIDRDAMTAAEDFYANNRLDASRLIATDKDGKKVLKVKEGTGKKAPGKTAKGKKGGRRNTGTEKRT